MGKVIFKHPEQNKIYFKLFNSVNQVCIDFKKDTECVAGYRDFETQKATNALVLATRKGAYQTEDGAVYTGKGEDRKCWASAYGKSNHCYCIVMDMDGWMEELTSEQLKPYGLCKPVPHEPWHITLIELVGVSQTEKEAIRDSVLNGIMYIKDFQDMTGLTADGINGPKTKAKAQELLRTCHSILGIPYFETAEQVIEKFTNNPVMWRGNLRTVRFLKELIMTIVKKMRGE